MWYSTYPNPSSYSVCHTKLFSALRIYSVVFYISQPIFLFSVPYKIIFSTSRFSVVFYIGYSNLSSYFVCHTKLFSALRVLVWYSTYPNPSSYSVCHTKLFSALRVFSVVFYIFQPIFLFCVPYKIIFNTSRFLVWYSIYPNQFFI